MASPDAARAAPAIAEGDPCKAVEAGRLNGSENTDTDDTAQADLPLIDRFGKRHGEQVLTAWSADAIAAMKLRRTDGRPL